MNPAAMIAAQDRFRAADLALRTAVMDRKCKILLEEMAQELIEAAIALGYQERWMEKKNLALSLYQPRADSFCVTLPDAEDALMRPV